MRPWWLTALLLALFSSTLSADQVTVEHRLNFENRKNQYVNVQMFIPVQGESISLSMPNWTPGSYMIREYAAHVESLKARGNSGKNLAVMKTEKNRWQIEVSGETQVSVEYSVWAGELAVNAAWVESDFALLNGAGIFLYNESTRDQPQLLQIDVPGSWGSVHVALPAAGAPYTFLARNYDELLDSPMLLGNPTVHPFEVEGHNYSLINQGDASLWDEAKAAADIARVVQSVQTFWQTNPLERDYLFLNIIADTSGGLEHDYSTVIMSSPWQMRNRNDYIHWLALASHEFFHAWNIRRMRPQVLGQYNYEREAYTRELWLAEGLSSYYDNLLLFRSGLITVDEYLALLAEEIRNYEVSPGRKVHSAEQASFDAWIKHYQPDANSINSSVSYYRKGSLIGFVADAAIREASKQKVSLDDILRDMYRLYGPDGSQSHGYPPHAFETLIEQRVGKSVADQIAGLLTKMTDPDVDHALDYYGLQLERSAARKAAEATNSPVPADFGLVWNSQESVLLVESVVRGGSGADAGVLPYDELLAINGQRVNRLNFQDRMLRLRPGETADLLLVRNGQVLTLQVKVQHALADKYWISIRPNIKQREKDRMEQWLGMQLTFIKH
jgi:predicted metalloprotease with PDZ domain